MFLEVLYLISLAVVAVIMYLRGGVSHLVFTAGAVGSLAVLHAVGVWRSSLLFGVVAGAQLLSIWLNVSILIGTKLNPFRAALNSADFRRLKGSWKSPSPTDDVRYVTPPVRWPTICLFAVGGVALVLGRPDLFGL